MRKVIDEQIVLLAAKQLLYLQFTANIAQLLEHVILLYVYFQFDEFSLKVTEILCSALRSWAQDSRGTTTADCKVSAFCVVQCESFDARRSRRH